MTVDITPGVSGYVMGPDGPIPSPASIILGSSEQLREHLRQINVPEEAIEALLSGKIVQVTFEETVFGMSRETKIYDQNDSS